MGFKSSKGLEKAEEAAANSGGGGMNPRFATWLYLRPKDKTKVVLLDGEGFNFYVHGMYIQGDKKAGKIHVACMSDSNDGDPMKCRICNAYLHDQRITRKPVTCLTVIDTRPFSFNGVNYVDMKKIAALPVARAKYLAEKAEEKGGLVRNGKGAMFSIYRGDPKSAACGDNWEYAGHVELAKHFANSKRLKQMMDAAQKAGKKLTPQEALKELIKPYDYEAEFDPTPARVNYFLAYLGIGAAAGDPETQTVAADAETVDYGSSNSVEAETSTDETSKDEFADDDVKDDADDDSFDDDDEAPKAKVKVKSKK
jgi:hypothetical protein